MSVYGMFAAMNPDLLLTGTMRTMTTTPHQVMRGSLR